MPEPTRHAWRVAAGYAVAAVLLWLCLRNTEWRVLLAGLRYLKWWWLGAAIVLRLLALIVSAMRWQVLLAPVRQVRLGLIVVATMAGMAVSALVSMQAAEAARPYWLSTRANAPLAATVATVAVEWLLDLLAVLVLFLPAQSLMAASTQWGRHDMTMTVAALALASATALVALRQVSSRGDQLRRWLQHSSLVQTRGAGRLIIQLEQSLEGLKALTSAKGLVLVTFYSLAIASLTALSAWLALLAFGLPLTVTGGLLVLGLITLGGMIPTPGAVGGFHAVCQFGLAALLKLDPSSTVAPVIGLHAVLYIPPAALGALCFLWAANSREGSPT